MNLNLKNRKFLVGLIIGLIFVGSLIVRLEPISKNSFLSFDASKFAMLFRFQGLPSKRLGFAYFYARPFLFLSAKIFSIFVGDNPGLTTVASCVFGALSLIVIFFLGKIYSSDLTGIIASLLMASSPTHIWYSRVGVGVAEGMFFCLLGFFLFIYFHPDKDQPFFAESRNKIPLSSFGFWISCAFIILSFYGLSHILQALQIQKPTLLYKYMMNRRIMVPLFQFTASVIVIFILIFHFFNFRKHPEQRSLQYQSLMIGGCFGLATTLHYSCLIFAILVLSVDPIRCLMKFEKPDWKKEVFLLTSLLLPLLFFQLINYPNADYFKEFFEQFPLWSTGGFFRNPSYYFQFLFMREKVFFMLAILIGNLFLMRNPSFKNIVLVSIFSLVFLLGTFVALSGSSYYAGRTIAMVLPLYMLLAAMGVISISRFNRLPDFGRVVLQFVFISLILISRGSLSVQATQVKSVIPQAAFWVGTRSMNGEVIAVTGQVDPWVYYFGSNRILDFNSVGILWPSKDEALSQIQEEWKSYIGSRNEETRRHVISSLLTHNARYLVWNELAVKSIPQEFFEKCTIEEKFIDEAEGSIFNYSEEPSSIHFQGLNSLIQIIDLRKCKS